MAGAQGRGPPWRLSRRGPACRPSPARDEVWDLFPGGERSCPGELKSLVCTISLTLASDFPSEPQFSPTEVGLLIPLESCVAKRLTDLGIRMGVCATEPWKWPGQPRVTSQPSHMPLPPVALLREAL